MPHSSRRRQGQAQDYVTRAYRDFSPRDGLVAFRVVQGETDLYIRAERDCTEEASNAVRRCRKELTDYIQAHPAFRTSLEPLPPDAAAPPIVRDMLQAARTANVGPMAAVAGAVSDYVGGRLRRHCPEVMVENGGDIHLSMKKATTVSIFAGPSPLSMRLGVSVRAEETPCGICTSSGTVGPSLSFGRADAVTVWAPTATLADAAATAIGNLISAPEDMEPALERAGEIPGLWGAVAILGDRVGWWGRIRVVRLRD